MPALKGLLTYARFYVQGQPPEGFSSSFMRAIRLRAMKPLEPDDEDLERSGWCKVGDPTAIELDHEDVFYNEYLNLGFRTDRWVIPGPLMRTRMREAESAYLEKKGRERLSRREKNELKLLVARKLRRSMTPATRVVDLSWSLGEGIVRFFSHATKPAGVMSELFKKTFGLDLVPESPYTLAARIGLDKADELAWNALEPTVLEPRLLDSRDAAAEEEEES